MEIDPGNMDFDKRKPNKNSNGEISVNRAKGIDGINNGAKYNPAPSFIPPAISTPTPNSGQPLASLKKPTELLSEAWKMYKARWKTLLGIVFAPMLLIILAVIVFGMGLWLLGLADVFGSALFGSGLENPSISLILLLFLFLVFVSAIIIVQIWSQVALIYAIKDDKDIGIKESYKRGRRKIKSFFWVSLLAGFIIMGGFVLFAVPGFIFAIWFSFAVFIVIMEDLKGMDAILKSREYVRNYWWAVFWRFLFMYIIIFGVMVVVTIVLILLPILENLVSTILTPLMMIYSFLIYEDLKRVKGDFKFQPSVKAKKPFIAVGVLGIIAVPLLFGSIVLVSLNNAKNKSMDIAHFTEISRLQTDLTMYYDEEGEYPESLSELSTGFMNPETKEPYEYRQLENGEDYEICAELRKKEKKCFSSENDVYNFYHNESYLENKDKESEYIKETFENTVKGRDKERIFDLYSISKMLKHYKTENGIYPVSRISVKFSEDNQIVDKIESANKGAKVPVDPSDPEYYYSYKSVDGKSFELTARLEDIDDSGCDAEIKKESGVCIYKLQD